MDVQTLLDQFWRAQARIGARVSAQVLSEWQLVSPLQVQVTGQRWLAAVLAIIRRERGASQRQAAAFYRLYRAEELGRTVVAPPPELSGRTVFAPPADGPTTTVNLGDLLTEPGVTLGELREDWAREAQLPRSPEPDDGETVPVDDFEWPDLDDVAHDRAAVASMVSTGVARAHTLTQQGRLDDPDFLASLADDFSSAGRRTAQAADREALRGGRDLIRRAGEADTAAVGWARVTDGNPCAFCAMLAARGAIYTSRERATLGGRKKPIGSPDARNPRNRRPPVTLDDLSAYHNGCHCQVVPIYSRNDFRTPGARRLNDEWNRVTDGLSGDNARRAWRRHIESQRSSR